MDDDQIKNALGRIDVPSSSKDDMHHAMDAGWDVIQSRKKKTAHRIKARFAIGGFLTCGLALFLSYSYLATISTVSGSGDASSETHLINSDQIAQYPAGVRTAVVRMIIGGAKPENLRFTRPDQLGTGNASNEVFHPEGGGAVFQDGPTDVMENGEKGRWFFNQALHVEGLGTEAGQIIAFLPGIKMSICQKANAEAVIQGIPVLDAGLADFYTKDMAGSKEGGFTPVLRMNEQPFACFQAGENGPYVYYHVLLEQ